MGRLAAVLLTLWCLCMLQVVAAAPEASFHVYRLGDSDLPAAAVLAGKYDASAMAVPTQALTPTPKVGGWWRLDILRDWPRDPPQALVLDATSETTAAAWLPGQSSPLIRSNGGANSDPAYSPRFHVFALADGLRAGQRIYLRVESATLVADTLRITGEHDLRAQDRRELRLNSLIYGTLLALTLVGMGLGLSLREPNFLLLGAGLGFSLLFLLDNSGEIYRFPGVSVFSGTRTFQREMGSGAALFTGLFLLRYLQMPIRAPWAAVVQRGCMVVYVVVMLCSLIPWGIGVRGGWALLGNVAVLVSTVACLWAGVKGAIAGDRPSKLFLWSWLPLLFCIAWRVVEVNSGLPANDALRFAFPASYVLAGILLFVGLGDRMLQYKRERDAADMLARRDPLTEVYNRRALDERLQAAALEAGQQSQPLALLFADLDHFKRINDEHGHDVGDECLREVARRIRGTLRFGDVLGRYGGEEFVIGLPRTHAEEASALGERIRDAISSQPILCGVVEHRLTVSIGVAVLHNGLAGFDEAIKRADRALYVSKRGGRDRVSLLPA
jgi:diguanylate cyclase (GGDEF)-like protein